MDKNTPKALAAGLLRKYYVQEPTLDDIVAMITDFEYDIIDFDLTNEKSSSSVLIDRLNLRPALTSSPALTYRKGDLCLVFVNSDLDTSGKLYALTHELGHIACGHLRSGNLGNYSVSEEYEANEFAHYLLNPDKLARVYYWMKKHFKMVFGTLLLLVILSFCIIALRDFLSSPSRGAVSEKEEYYVTDDGNRYHEENCMTIRNNETVHLMTEEEFKSGKYSPCQVCLP